MKVVLYFEYETKEEDGIGTQNDAMICAIRNLLHKLNTADGTDDAIAVFKETSVLS